MKKRHALSFLRTATHEFQLFFNEFIVIFVIFVTSCFKTVCICMHVYLANVPKRYMEYPTGTGRKHSQTGYRRNGLEGATHLMLYGYDSDMKFTSERISRFVAFLLNHWIWPRLYKDFDVECNSCLENRSILSKRLPKRWECTKCLQSEPETAFI